MSSFVIDPDAVLDYDFDWKGRTHWTPDLDWPQPKRDWLATGETITSYTIVPTLGVHVDSSSEADGVVTAWVSGPVGPVEKLTCHITTSQGRTDDRTLTLNVRQR